MASPAYMLVSLYVSIVLLILKCQRNLAADMLYQRCCYYVDLNQPTDICYTPSKFCTWENKTQGTAPVCMLPRAK